MAREVERALTEGRHLIVEAGTGTGKTLAYLLPALRTGQRVIISTGTKNLQEQLYFRDLPFLESLLGPLQVCYMKGRANYLCRHKLYALERHPILNGLEEIDHFQRIREWEKTTATGDRVEIDGMPEASPVWSKLDARSEACLGQTCPDYGRCFITEMRRRALESDVIIVNHHLFFADLAIKQTKGAPDAGVLPEAAAVIFDEAHELESVASNYFGISMSNLRLDELARDVEATLKAKNAFSSGLKACGEMLRERGRLFFAALPQAPGGSDGRMPFLERQEFLETQGDIYSGVVNALSRLEGELESSRGVEEAPGLKKRAALIRDDLHFLLEGNSANTVFWIDRRGLAAGGLSGARTGSPARQAARNTYLQATPIDVSGLFSSLLFESYPSVILTSATLAVEGGFAHLRKRLGVSDARELVVPSHFCYPEQALLYLPPEMPNPADEESTVEAARCIRRVLDITRGRAFCLFTSYRKMREVHDRLLPELDFPCLLQGSASRKALLEEFRSKPNAVLFATSSFWQGVDVQGEALSCVIIDRLPFAVPSDPVVAARMRAIASGGGSAFFEYQVPGAVISLKQGFGRLIRSLEDRGLLVLLDPRISQRRYGRIFLDSLPPYRVTNDIAEVERFFAPKETGAPRSPSPRSPSPGSPSPGSRT